MITTFNLKNHYHMIAILCSYEKLSERLQKVNLFSSLNNFLNEQIKM